MGTERDHGRGHRRHTRAFALGAVGRPGPGVEVKEAEDGELLVRGPVVFSGYLQADGGIEPATDADGWLPTGDVGAVDSRGIVSVTDRKKELIITAGGKNIAPTRIESLLRAHPLIGQAVAIGDRRRYVTALIVLDEEAARCGRGPTGSTPPTSANLPATPRCARRWTPRSRKSTRCSPARNASSATGCWRALDRRVR
ncbi:hypothetical protein NKH77_50675 [Streptomyces sp. M19]